MKPSIEQKYSRRYLRKLYTLTKAPELFAGTFIKFITEESLKYLRNVGVCVAMNNDYFILTDDLIYVAEILFT